MQRQITQELLTWKNDPARKPLILKGVRQCGKTWILKQFGKEHFTDTAYFNFEGNTSLHNVFVADLNPDRILTELGLLRGSPILPGTTLLIFDEIQFCPAALTSLKYFAENLPAQHIAGARITARHHPCRTAILSRGKSQAPYPLPHELPRISGSKRKRPAPLASQKYVQLT